MDTRFKQRGYGLLFYDNGASGGVLEILRHGKIVGEVAIGIFKGGPDEPVGIRMKRYVQLELPVEVFTADN